MQKPNGYDETRAGGEFTPVELGGHYAVIKQVSEMQSSTGKDMVVVLFDFDDSDAQAGYFAHQFENDDRPEKKWPFPGKKYIMIADYNDPSKTSRAFKTFCTSAEKSNNFQIQWGGNNWAAQFVGKKIGVVFGEEESEYEGKVSMRRVPKWFCEYSKAENQKIPQAKLLSGVVGQPAPAAEDNSFINIPDGVHEEIPF